MAQFSLSWDAYKQNICRGLSSLQQNGEFVDMTLAADGHHVKVHQVIMSLVSPFIKELITSAQCSHPVVFLNKMSYQTLCSMLEYIYTGEVLVAKENLTELIEAARELKISGLEEMKLELTPPELVTQVSNSRGKPLSTSLSKSDQVESFVDITGNNTEQNVNFLNDTPMDDNFDDTMELETDDTRNLKTTQPEKTKGVDAFIQYTVSNHGSLQLILNRCLYYLRYTSRKASGHRQWKCIESMKNKCPATVITQDDVVVKRFGVHNHPFHDRQILKKVRDNAVYSAVNDAEAFGVSMKNARQEIQQKDSSAKTD